MKSFNLTSLILLLCVALTPMQGAVAADLTGAGMPVAQGAPSAKADLRAQAYLLWQQINEARRNPRQAMARLGVSEQTAVAALGSDAWLLDQGLPPLAWNAQLQSAAQNHGRDMVGRLYYSHVSPSGAAPSTRIAATGYEAVATDETLAALVFELYLDANVALAALFDNMLLDELTGVAGVSRNIFSTTLTEVGIGFLAESVALLDGKPYVYLVVADFGAPVETRYFAVGQIDAGSRLLVRNRIGGIWNEAEILPGNTFQLQISGAGEDLYYWNELAPDFVDVATTQDFAWGWNHSLDLRR